MNAFNLLKTASNQDNSNNAGYYAGGTLGLVGAGGAGYMHVKTKNMDTAAKENIKNKFQAQHKLKNATKYLNARTSKDIKRDKRIGWFANIADNLGLKKTIGEGDSKEEIPWFGNDAKKRLIKDKEEAHNKQQATKDIKLANKKIDDYNKFKDAFITKHYGKISAGLAGTGAILAATQYLSNTNK